MTKKTGFHDRELSLKRVSVVMGLLLAGPVLYFAYITITAVTPLAEQFAADSGNAYFQQLVTQAQQSGDNRKALAEIDRLLAQNEEEAWRHQVKWFAVPALGALRATETPVADALPENLDDVKIWWHHPFGRDAFLWQGRWIELGTPITKDYFFSGLIIPQDHSQLRNGFRVRLTAHNGSSRSYSLGACDLTGEFWTFNNSNKIFCRDVPLEDFLKRFGERVGKTYVELEADAGLLPVNGVFNYKDPEIFMGYLSQCLPLEITANELRLRYSRHDILPMFNIGLGGSRNKEIYKLVYAFNLRTCLGISKSDADLVPRDRITFLHNDRDNPLPFYVPLQEFLHPRGQDFVVRDDHILDVFEVK